MKLAFIGAGNMAQAIISGLLSNREVEAKNIAIYEINTKTRDRVVKQFGVTSLENISSGLSVYDGIVLAVKPQVFKNFSSDKRMQLLPTLIESDQLIISIMAGVSIETIQAFFAVDIPVVRCMPNTPALIGQSMSVLSGSIEVSDEQMDSAAQIFASVGQVEIMDEHYLDAVTGLSGSGPAYVYTFIESLIQGGILCGLSMPIARKLAVQTVLGSVMMINDDTLVEQLKYNVTSPGGTTIEALSVLEQRGFRSAVMDAVRASCRRSQELAKGK